MTPNTKCFVMMIRSFATTQQLQLLKRSTSTASTVGLLFNHDCRLSMDGRAVTVGQVIIIIIIIIMQTG